jgi:hypothetical protein
MSNLEHLRRQFLGAWDSSPLFLSMCQPLDAVLFYTSLGRILQPCHASRYGLRTRTFRASVAPSVTGCLDLLASALVGGSLDEMKQKYEAQRDKEFAAHVCVKHMRGARPKTE